MIPLWEHQCVCQTSLTLSTPGLCHKGEEGMHSTIPAQTLPSSAGQYLKAAAAGAHGITVGMGI